MNATRNTNETDLYLRLSDGRVEEALEGREAKLRAEAARRDWTVRRVITENDLTEQGTLRPASAWKRHRVTLPSGHVAMRVIRPRFRGELLPDMMSGVNVIVEYADRIARDHRDGEDFLEAAEIGRVSVVSLNGRLTLTEGGTAKERDDFRDELRFAAREGQAKQERAQNGRERWAGRSYQGGKRPFGFRHVKGTDQYRRTLAIDPAEAKVIRDAATAILDQGVSLKSVARDLRAGSVPTVTGTAWTASTLRDILSKPAVAGLAVLRGKVVGDAPWDAILPRDQWERLVSLFESRRTGRSPEPRWLISCHARCGVCDAGMKCTGTAARRRYTCSGHGHVSRDAVKLDELISYKVVARLSLPDAADLLKPPQRQGADTARLRDEAKKLHSRTAKLGEMYGLGQIGDDALTSGTRAIKTRLAEIDAQLAVSDAPDPLKDFRDSPAEIVWEGLSVARRREVVKVLMPSVVVNRAARAGRFSEDDVAISWAGDGVAFASA